MSTLKTNNIQHVDRSDPSIIINTDGSVNIAGTMTYEDVTNVDAVGIITGRSLINAQKQIHVGTGVSVKAGGLNVTAGITTVQALQATTLTLTNDLFMSDGDQIELGTDNDLKIYHSGFNYIESHNDSEIHINANTGGSVENMAKFKPNGAVELYHNNTKTFETTSTGVKTLGDVSLRTSSNTQTIIYDESDGQIEFLDNIKASFGTGGDLLIHHNGSVNVIDAATSNPISFRYGGSEQFFIGNAEFKGGDNKKIKLGTGDDLQIYHSGSHSFIQDTGTGNLEIRSSKVAINNAANNANLATFTDGGAVDLYHNGTLKLNTSSAGVTIQNGHLVMNRQDTGNEGGEIVFNRASDNSGQWVNDVYGNDSAARLRWHSGGVEKLNLLTTGNLEIPNGNLVIGTGGKGIDFSAAPNVGGMDNELFDDYEEGTFTMTMSPSTSGTISLTTTIDSLRYTKIGNVVFIHGRVRIESVSSPVGGLQIGGLPYAAIGSNSNSQDGYQHFGVNTHGVNIHDSTVQVFGELAPNATGAGIFSMFDNSNWAILAASALQGNTNEYFGFNFFYHTAT